MRNNNHASVGASKRSIVHSNPVKDVVENFVEAIINYRYYTSSWTMMSSMCFHDVNPYHSDK